MAFLNEFEAQQQQWLVAEVGVTERVDFIRKTYGHLVGAVLAFVGLEVAFFQTGIAENVARFAFQTNWLLFLGGFMVAGFVASRLARSETGPVGQYVGLGLYIVADVVLFIPLLYIAMRYAPPTVLTSAIVTTLLAFTGLTAAVFLTGKDFSFLRVGISIGGFLALGLIVAGVCFGVSLGLWFSVGMAGLAAFAVLYDTSNVMRHYRTDQHVAASLALFASIALLFWYVLRIFLGSRD